MIDSDFNDFFFNTMDEIPVWRWRRTRIWLLPKKCIMTGRRIWMEYAYKRESILLDRHAWYSVEGLALLRLSAPNIAIVEDSKSLPRAPISAVLNRILETVFTALIRGRKVS